MTSGARAYRLLPSFGSSSLAKVQHSVDRPHLPAPELITVSLSIELFLLKEQESSLRAKLDSVSDLKLHLKKLIKARSEGMEPEVPSRFSKLLCVSCEDATEMLNVRRTQEAELIHRLNACLKRSRAIEIEIEGLRKDLNKFSLRRKIQYSEQEIVDLMNSFSERIREVRGLIRDYMQGCAIFRKCVKRNELMSWFISNDICLNKKEGKWLVALFIEYGILIRISSSRTAPDLGTLFRFRADEKFLSQYTKTGWLTVLTHVSTQKLFFKYNCESRTFKAFLKPNDEFSQLSGTIAIRPVRLNHASRFQFDVSTTSSKTLTLRAKNQDDFEEWVKAFNSTMCCCRSVYVHNGVSPFSGGEEYVMTLRSSRQKVTQTLAFLGAEDSSSFAAELDISILDDEKFSLNGPKKDLYQIFLDRFVGSAQFEVFKLHFESLFSSSSSPFIRDLLQQGVRERQIILQDAVDDVSCMSDSLVSILLDLLSYHDVKLDFAKRASIQAAVLRSVVFSVKESISSLFIVANVEQDESFKRHLTCLARDESEVILDYFDATRFPEITDPANQKTFRDLLCSSLTEFSKEWEYVSKMSKLAEIVQEVCKLDFISKSGESMGADDTISVLICSLLLSDLEHIYADIAYLQTFLGEYESNMNQGYYLTCVIAAVHYLEGLRAAQ